MPKAKPIPAGSHAGEARQPAPAPKGVSAGRRAGKGPDGESGTKLKSRPNATEVASSVELPDWKTMPAGQREKMLIDLARKGYSCSVIAGHFQNCSRNAVIGKLRRIEQGGREIKRNHVSLSRKSPVPAGITPPPRPKVGNRGRAANNAAYNIQMKVQQRAQEARPDQKPAQDVVAYQNLMAKRRDAFLPLPGVKPVALINIPMLGCCRWPVEVDQPGHFFCGDAARTESVWCAAHHRLATQSKANTKELIDG